jgi:hypothetical protein
MLKRQHVAALQIQTNARQWLVHSRLAGFSALAIKLQGHSRRHIAQDRFARKQKLQSMLARLKRCKDARKLTGRMKESASMIDSTAEMRLSVVDFSIQNVAAVEIQKIARGYLARNRVRLMRDIAPLKMQCLVRVLKAKEETERRRAWAAQQRINCSVAHEHKLENMQNVAALRIQTLVKARHMERNYRLRVHPAVVKIQSAFRMALMKKRRSQMVGAVVRIQKFLRRFLTPRMLVRSAAACHIQRAFRKYGIRRCLPNDYLQRVRAAVVIQAARRCQLMKQLYHRKHDAVCVIQAAARGRAVKAWQLKRFKAALKIQSSIVRPFLCKRRVQERWQKVLKLQAFARRVLSQKRLRHRQRRALQIQALRYRFFARNSLGQLAAAATKIQAYVRMWRRLPFGPAPIAHKRRAAAIKLQALARGFLVRRFCKVQRDAAVVIQQTIRARRSHQVMSRYRWLVAALQRLWRAHQVRVATKQSFNQLRKVPAICRGGLYRAIICSDRRQAATNIQRVARAVQCRQRSARRNVAATFVQKFWRMYVGKKRWKQICSARKRIGMMVFRHRWKQEMQETIALNVKLRRVFQKFLPHARARGIKQKVLFLQSVLRGWQCRRELERSRLAAARMQAGVRYGEARAGVHARWRALAVLQAGFDMMRRQRVYARHKKLIVMMQSYVRGGLARKSRTEANKAALDITRTYRGFRARHQKKDWQGAITLIESAVRMWLSKLHYRRVQTATQQIQREWRKSLARRLVKRRVVAATKIAATWRMHRCRHNHKRVCAAGSYIVCAAWMWRHMQRKKRIVAAATRVASVWRGYCVRMNMSLLAKSANRIHHWWRDQKAFEHTMMVVMEVMIAKRKLQLEHMEEHAIVIQRSFRRWRLWRKGMYLVKRMVLRMQARYRSWRPKREVVFLRAFHGVHVKRLPWRLVALVPDKRGKLTRYRAFRQKERRCKHDARIIRTEILPLAVRHDIEQLVEQIQAFVRWRQRMSKIRTCQRLAHGFLARRQLRRKQCAARVLQNWWIGYSQKWYDRKTDFQVYRQKIVLLQALYRGWSQRKKLGIRKRDCREMASIEQEELAPEVDGHIVQDVVREAAAKELGGLQ